MSNPSKYFEKKSQSLQIQSDREPSPVIFLDQAAGWGSPVSLRNEKHTSPNSKGNFSEKLKSCNVSPMTPLVKGVLKNKQDSGQQVSTATKSVISEQNTPYDANKVLNNFMSTKSSTNNDKKIEYDNSSQSQYINDLVGSSNEKAQHKKQPSNSGNVQYSLSGSYTQIDYKNQISTLCKKIEDQSKRIQAQEILMQKMREKEKQDEQELKEISQIYQKQKIIIEQQVEVEKQLKFNIEDLQNELISKKNTIECLKIDHIEELQSIFEKNQQEFASLRQSMIPTVQSIQESNHKLYQPLNSTQRSQLIEDSVQAISNKKSSEVKELLQKLHKIDENTANLLNYERQEKVYLHQRVKELNLRINELEQELLEKEGWCQRQINAESDKIYKFFENENSKQDMILIKQKEVMRVTYEDQFIQVQDLLQKQKSRNKDIVIELKQQVQENEKLIEKQSTIEQQSEKVSLMNQVLKNQNIEFSTIIANQKQKLTLNNEEITTLNCNIKNNTNQIQQQNIQIASLEGQVKELSKYRQEQMELAQKHLNLQKDFENLQQTSEQQKLIFLELQEDNKVLTEQLNNFRSNELGDQIEQFKRGCSEDELKLKNQHLEQVLKEKDIYIEELIEFQSQNKQNAEKKVTDYISQQKELIQQQEQLKEQNFSLIKELEKLKTQQKSLENQHLETLSAHKQEIQNLYSQLQMNQLEQKGEESEIKRTQDQVLNVKNEYGKLKVNYNQLEVEKERLEFMIEELKLDSQRADLLQEQNTYYIQQNDELIQKVQLQGKTIMQQQQSIFSLEEALSQVETI